MKHLNKWMIIFLFACLGTYGQMPDVNRKVGVIDYSATNDSAHTQESEAARMYQSAVSKMRRDVSIHNTPQDSTGNLQRINTMKSELSSPPPPKTDSLSVTANGNQLVGQLSPERRPKIKKSVIILAIGSFAIIGCGLVVYLVKASKNDNIIEQNNRIPPPPDPPMNLAPLFGRM